MRWVSKTTHSVTSWKSGKLMSTLAHISHGHFGRSYFVLYMFIQLFAYPTAEVLHLTRRLEMGVGHANYFLPPHDFAQILTCI